MSSGYLSNHTAYLGRGINHRGENSKHVNFYVSVGMHIFWNHASWANIIRILRRTHAKMNHCYASILSNHIEAHAKTWNGKWSGMKNRTFINTFKGNASHLDAITHVGIGNTIKCVFYYIEYDSSISFRSVCHPVFRSVPCFSKHPMVCVNLHPNFSLVFLSISRAI
jgi:hypothetical protein